MKWITRGDIDGFFGLALDNLIQLLLIAGLCGGLLGMSDALVYGRILPGAAVSLVLGNVYYARQAMQLARSTGREDVCALPYGINTVSLFAFVFLVMLPAKLSAEAAGLPDPGRVAWQAGLAACLGSGLVELFGSFVADYIRRWLPRAALLSTLSGIALGFISLGFLFRTYANPVVGLSTLAVVMLVYFGRVKFKGGLPGGLVAVTLGTLLAWMTGLAPVGGEPTRGLGLHLPVPVIGDLLEGVSSGQFATWMAVIVPMGVFSVVGSLQNLESAEAAGDRYETVPSLAVNGLGTLAAALFGSCFPTTIYIGHPGWKAMGARAGYSVLNGVFASFVALSGTLAAIAWAVPIDAGMAIVLWIGLVITAQAFQAVPREHAPAVVVGILPSVAAWGTLLAKNGLRAAGIGSPAGGAFGPELIDAFHGSDTWIHGAFALEQGFIFTSMLLSAATVAIIERRFGLAAAWFGVCAALSATGIMHGYTFTYADATLALGPAWPWVTGYLAMAAVMLLARFVTEPGEGH